MFTKIQKGLDKTALFCYNSIGITKIARKDFDLTMKKSILCLLLALCLCFSIVLLTSCKKLTDGTEPTKGTTEPEKMGEVEFTQNTGEGAVLPRNDDSTNKFIDDTVRYTY